MNLHFSTSLVSWFPGYPLLATNIAGVTIFYSHNVLKAFQLSPCSSQKFANDNGKILVIYDVVYASLILYSLIVTLDEM